MRALMLCAGKGERLRPLTNTVAKPAISLLNIPIWSYPLALAETLGFEELHVNTHYLPDTITASFKRFPFFNYPIYFHHEEQLLQSGGPLWHLERLPKAREKDILLLNGDGVLLTKDFKVLKRMYEDHKKANALATVLCMPLEGAGKTFSGLWMDEGGNIKDLGVGTKPADLTAYHYASFIILSPRIYDHLPQGASNIFTDVLFPAGRKHELVQAYISRDLTFYEIGNPEGLQNAQREMEHLIQTQDAQTNLTDILDRFAPGWRNQKI